MNGGIDPDPCEHCWSCGKLAFLNKRDAMGGLWLKDGVCNKCRATKVCVECRKKLNPSLSKMKSCSLWKKICCFLFGHWFKDCPNKMKG